MSLRYLLPLSRHIAGCSRFCSSYKPIKRPASRSKGLEDSKVESSRGRMKQVSHHDFLTALKTQINAAGPMTVADYMRRVLTNPAAGYYMNHDVFGSKGDYITSPEINQIFGELISLWCLMEWKKVGAPTPLQIIELGPGRGTMIQDILRVLTRFDAQQSLSVHLVEVSPYLAKAQSGRLCYKSSESTDENEKYYLMGETVSGIKMYWYKHLQEVPFGFSIVLAHEFFDALPIHKLQKVDSVWKEILIDVNEEKADEQFRYVMSKNETPMSKMARKLIPRQDEREHVEYSPEQQLICKELAKRLESHGGIALIMDYGHLGEKGDTFRSFKNHQIHSPLKDPGTADLTADVDFEQMKRHFEEDDKCIACGPIAQRDFIKRMGGDTRINVLIEKATGDQKDQLKSGYDMLTDINQMGQRFKFLAVYPKVLESRLRNNPPTAFKDE